MTMTPDDPALREKYRRLVDFLRRFPTLAVAFSGGVDSTLLLDVACEVLGPGNVVAVTMRGANFPEWEGREADAFAASLGARHVVAAWDPMALPGFVENGPDRCYHCKRDVFALALALARSHGAEALADGANVDDEDDYRPGAKAARELGVASPLRDCGLGKADVRELLRLRGRDAWDKPSFACLASRIPYGTAITAEALGRIERAEAFLAGLGFRNVRVRDHGDVARIEVEAADRDRFSREELWEAADRALRQIGYRYVALDLRGYRRGSLNEALPPP